MYENESRYCTVIILTSNEYERFYQFLMNCGVAQVRIEEKNDRPNYLRRRTIGALSLRH